MQLQQFVTQIIEELGGIVEPIEYALCNVLIPEAYTSSFQNRAEIMLAFDFEVAQENPEAEFITFGSYIFEQLLAIVQEQAVSTLRFAEVERLEVGNPLKKITDFLKDESGKIQIVEERQVLGVWGAFQYQITYVSDEKIEASHQIWVNFLTNEVSQTMETEQNRIIYKNEPLYNYPIPVQMDLREPLNIAAKYVKQKAEQEHNHESKTAALEKDVTRITNYYTDLLKENEKRVNRKGLSDERKQEIKAKSAAIELEKDKQLQEIYDKYNGNMEIDLDNGILYFIPLLEFKINIEFRNSIKTKTIYFNPVTKQFFAGKVGTDRDN